MCNACGLYYKLHNVSTQRLHGPLPVVNIVDFRRFVKFQGCFTRFLCFSICWKVSSASRAIKECLVGQLNDEGDVGLRYKYRLTDYDPTRSFLSLVQTGVISLSEEELHILHEMGSSLNMVIECTTPWYR